MLYIYTFQSITPNFCRNFLFQFNVLHQYLYLLDTDLNFEKKIKHKNIYKNICQGKISTYLFHQKYSTKLLQKARAGKNNSNRILTSLEDNIIRLGKNVEERKIHTKYNLT